MTINNKMKRKYERPAMLVVELQRHAPLICTSADATMTVTYEEEDF